VGSILLDQISQVVQGGQLTVQVMFETFVGSGFEAGAGDVTVEISAAAVPTGGEGTPVPVTSENVTTVDGSFYSYVFDCPADQPPGDYLVTWTGVVGGAPQTWTSTISVEAIPTGAPSPGVYATVAQYRAETEDQITPEMLVRKWLRKASKVIDHATIGAVYAHTPNGMPTDGIVIQAFMQATCAQAEFMIADNDPTGVKRQYQSTSMGGVSLTRAQGTTGLVFPPLAPEAAMILHTAGVLGVAVLIDW
jgi:hypothetical protein